MSTLLSISLCLLAKSLLTPTKNCDVVSSCSPSKYSRRSTLDFGIVTRKVSNNVILGNRVERETFRENGYVPKYCTTVPVNLLQPNDSIRVENLYLCKVMCYSFIV